MTPYHAKSSQHTKGLNLTGFKRLRQLTPSRDDIFALEHLQQQSQQIRASVQPTTVNTAYKRRKLIDWVNTQQRRVEEPISPVANDCDKQLFHSLMSGVSLKSGIAAMSQNHHRQNNVT